MKKLFKALGITIALTTVAAVIKASRDKDVEPLMVGNIESYPTWVQEMIKG